MSISAPLLITSQRLLIHSDWSPGATLLTWATITIYLNQKNFRSIKYKIFRHATKKNMACLKRFSQISPHFSMLNIEPICCFSLWEDFFFFYLLLCKNSPPPLQLLPHPTPRDHDFHKHGSTLSENESRQVSAFLAEGFSRIRFFKLLTMLQ